jgi:hypothetical protein
LRTQGNRRATLAVALSALALVAAVGGPAIADQMKTLIGGKQIKKNVITSKHVKNGTLTVKDFKTGSLPAGPRGPEGPAGPPGATGPIGPAGSTPPVDATAFTIPLAKRTWGPVLELGAFKLLGGCQADDRFSIGHTWEGGIDPAFVELFQTRSHTPLPPPDPTRNEFDVFQRINNGAGSSTGVIAGTYRWDFVATSPTGSITATIWHYGNDTTETCRMAAHGYLEGDAALVK